MKKSIFIIMGFIVAYLLAYFVIFYTFSYVYNNVLNEMPDTDKEEVKTSMYQYIKQYDDRPLKEISFKVTPNNNLEGVPGEHILYLVTKDGFGVQVRAMNDSLDVIATDYMSEMVQYKFYRDFLGRTSIDIEKDNDDDFNNSTDYGSDNIYTVLDFSDVYSAISKESSTPIQKYFEEHYERLIRENIEFILYYDFEGKEKDVKNISEKEKNAFYESYVKIFEDTKELFPIRAFINVHEEDKDKSIFIAMFNIDDENNHALLSREEFMARFENPSAYKMNPLD